MFICIQMFELYFLTNYKLPTKVSNTKNLRDSLTSLSHMIGEETGTQRAESTSTKANHLVDRSGRCPNSKPKILSNTPHWFFFTETF